MLFYPYMYTPQLREDTILNQDRFVWEAPARIRYERGPRWYLFMAVAAIFLVAYAIWTANFLFAFLVILIAIILVLAGNEHPHTVLAQIGDQGIVWNGKLYPFQELSDFAVVYQPPVAKLVYFECKNPWRLRLKIPLEDQDPVEVRQHLKQYLQENADLQTEHLSDIIGRLLKL